MEVYVSLGGGPGVWGARTAPTSAELVFPESPDDLHAARSHSLISPPRTLRRRISAVARSAMTAGTISLAPGGRRFRARCGRWVLLRHEVARGE
jgi:hypothetical protein